jgi:predicted nuclease of restriction endonuclease-like (RecB) superfamily
MDEKKVSKPEKQQTMFAESDTEFYKQVADLLAAARQFAKQQLDTTIVTTYYEIGRMIIEREQQGQKRAKYGASLIKGLSEYLTEQYGRGFSVANLKNIRKFYQTYAPSIGQTPSALFKLTWSHYQILMRIENTDARRFYEIEAKSQQWSVRQLQRQVGSSLYERLGLSRDKEKVMALAREGQTIESPRDIFKSPYVLEFTGLEERAEYSESELEQALIDNLQKFLLELGKGFLFEARQKWE